jgi:S-adenosylmethionine hydrolase
MKQRILVITDCIDVAANELYATLEREIEKNNSGIDIAVEPIVFVQEFSIISANFVARLLAEIYNPESLTILVVVNPLNTATKRRARIAGRLKNGIKFVGANTGAFTWLINDFGLMEVCETSQAGLKGKGFISFGGKFVHAPIAAKLAGKNDLHSIKVADFLEEDLEKTTIRTGTVLYIDNFGVPKINIKDSELNFEQGDTVALIKNDKEIGLATYCNSMKELSDGQTAIYRGSSLGLIEVGIVRETSTATKLGLAVGDVVKLVKK